MTPNARTLQETRGYPRLPKQIHFEEINSAGSPSAARESNCSKGIALMAAPMFILEYAVSLKWSTFYSISSIESTKKK